MGRRSDHTRDELKQMALEVAESLIEEEGVAGLSARKITTKMGYTVGTLYNLYHNLDDLILHLNARTLEALYQQLQATLSHNTKAEEKPLRLAEAYIAFSREHFALWSLLLEHRLPESQAMPEWYQERINTMFALIEGVLLPLVSHHKEKAQKAGKVLWAGLHGICALSLRGKLDTAGAGSAKDLAKQLITCYLAGIPHAA